MLRMRSYLTRPQLNWGVRHHSGHEAMRVLVWMALAAGSVSPLRAQVPSKESAQAVVARLYAEYAWETKDDSTGKKEPLFSAKRAVMARYLDTELIGAVLADRACEARTGGECNLSFVPMWDSQDPGGVTVQVVATKSSSIVQARLHYPYQNEMRVVTYRMRQTPVGWRVADMSGVAWPSLLKLLRRPVKSSR